MNVSILIYSCAAVSAPEGGPKDETPPQLISSNPESGTLQFKGGKVTLSFSEYIDEKSVPNSIKISPRLEELPTITYEDDKLIIHFPDTLLSDQTYVVTINRNLTDERKVAIDQSFQVAFTTGDIIDEGIISGRVYGDEEYAVHLWKVTSELSDSIFFTDPLYVTEADKEGNFEFKYLAAGNYVILGVDRSASGNKLIPDRMAYGVSSKKVYKLEEKSQINHIPLRVKKQIPLIKLTHGEWVGQKWGWIYFNQEIDSLNIDNIILTDESNKQFSPSIFRDIQDKTRALLILDDTLAKGKVELDIFSKIESLDRKKINFRVSGKRDTTNIKRIKPEGAKTIRVEKGGGPSIPIVFSKPIIQIEDSVIIMITDSDTLIEKANLINPIQINYTPSIGWVEKTDYNITIISEKLRPIEGKLLLDSTITIPIKSEKKLGYGGISGFINKNHNKTLLKLTSLNDTSKFFYSPIDTNLKFIFKSIPEGAYSLSLIIDEDNNGSYTFGAVIPFQPSEWFYIYPDTFNIRSNWDIDVGTIKIEEGK
ncbi:MAG: Ig-like domain-containing protein [Candidatus Marinimicrobia bacterium]|nr:Ig-like domain-containing protein [Candidatus Neomarinimicrobiota bacterium]